MARNLLIATFDNEAAFLDATSAAREARGRIEDAYSPYPVHGLDEAMGLRRTRLGIVCFLFGLSGVILGLGFQIWATVVDWPINIGGKTHAAIPALIPVTFEITVLFAAVGTVLVFFWRSRLMPGREPGLPAEGVTDDRFALVIEPERGAVGETRKLLKSLGALEINSAEADE